MSNAFLCPWRRQTVTSLTVSALSLLVMWCLLKNSFCGSMLLISCWLCHKECCRFQQYARSYEYFNSVYGVDLHIDSNDSVKKSYSAPWPSRFWTCTSHCRTWRRLEWTAHNLSGMTSHSVVMYDVNACFARALVLQFRPQLRYSVPCPNPLPFT